MKILITEDKRYQLTYKILDSILGGLTRKDVDLNTDTVYSNQQIHFIDEDGNIVIKWGENSHILYILRDAVLDIGRMFSFDEGELNRIILWWFKDRVGVESYEVWLVGEID
jgi:hypothetical protein